MKLGGCSIIVCSQTKFYDMGIGIMDYYFLCSVIVGCCFFDETFVSSSSRSIQRQMSSIFYFRDFLRVDFGLIPKKNPTLTFVRDWNLIVLIQVRFLRNVSKMPLVELYFDSYLSWDTIYADSGVNGIDIRFVILYSMWSKNKVL